MRPFLCIELLNTFSKKELDSLSEIASCQYFNTDKYVIKLLETLKKSVLGKRTFTPDVQVSVYKKVFSVLPTSKKTLNKKEKGILNVKMNVLTRLAEKFLSIQTLEQDESYKCDLLYNKLLERKQFWLFNRHIAKDKKLLTKKTKKEDYYKHFYKLEKTIFDYLHLDGKLVKKDNIPDIDYALDVNYILRKLSLYAAALSLKNASAQKKYNFSTINAIGPLLDLPQYAQNTHIALSRLSYELMETQSSEVYLDLLESLDKFADSVPTLAQKNYYSVATSFCAGRIRKGELDYTQDMFDLHKVMHKKNLLIENGVMPIRILKNMITMGCQTENFEWSEEILEYYYPFIRENVRESVYQYNMGMIAFHQKKYDKAHDKFIQVNKVDIAYDINVRVLILKCLYEKEKEYDEYTMQSFRSADKFFRTNKILTEQNKKGYINFINILINLYNIRHGDTKVSIDDIAEKLTQQALNSDKRWLLAKIEELKGYKRRF